MVIQPQHWVSRYQPLPDGFWDEHGEELQRVWPSVAEEIDRVAREFGINPRLLLCRMQLEQSALTYSFNGTSKEYKNDTTPISLVKEVLEDDGVVIDGISTTDAKKLYYLCGADKTDSGPRKNGWFGPIAQLLACAARFKYWYRGNDGPLSYQKNWLGLAESSSFSSGVPITRSGVTITPENQLSADCLRYTTSMAAADRLRKIAMNLFGSAEFEEQQEVIEMTAPNIVDRKLKFPRAFQKRTMTDRIMVHHSASATGDARTFHQWHLNQGWNGIGYHYVICKDGVIELGRPSWAVSANTMNHNYHTIGVNMVGNFMGGVLPTPEQIQSLVKLLAWLCVEWNLKPGNILGHRDLNSTSCPGDTAYAMLPEIRKMVAAAMGTPQSELTIPSVRFGDNDERDGGNDVKRVQEALNKKGCTLVIDGDCGRLTLAAITDFQSKNGLEPDGIVGPMTWAKLSK